MEQMTELRLSKKLWIADLHDIDASIRYDSKLMSLKTDKQCLHLCQDVIFANSYRRRSPMVTMSLSIEGYTPSLQDLTFVYNTRSCFHSEYTILAGSYWENEIKDKCVIKFYENVLRNDPAVISHRKFHNNEEENNNDTDEDDGDILEDEVETKWSWRQSYSNFPFLLFTTCKPLINQISLQNRTEVDCIVVWNVVQKNKTIGKAYFLPYGIPDMVGEAGIAIFHDQHKNLMGIYMSEKIRDTLISKDKKKYRLAQEFCMPNNADQSIHSTSVDGVSDGLNLPHDMFLGNLLGANSMMTDPTELLCLLALCGDSGSESSDDMFDSLISDDEMTDELDDYDEFDELIEDLSDYCISSNGDIYGPNEYEPPLVMFARTGNMAAVKKCVEATGSSPVNLNVSRKWTEVEEKWGKDKSWDWHDNTALIAASRSGHFDIVKYLLQLGADPTLKCCPRCDVYETAIDAAEDALLKKKKIMDEIINGKILEGTASSYEIPKDVDPRSAAITILEKITGIENIIKLLKDIDPFWKKASYSSAHYSNDRQRVMSTSPNQPTDTTALKTKISEFITYAVVLTKLDELADGIKKIRPKIKHQDACKHSAILTFSSNYTNTGSSNNSVCKMGQCKKKAAITCQHNCCGTCCPGRCKRHDVMHAKKKTYRRY